MKEWKVTYQDVPYNFTTPHVLIIEAETEADARETAQDHLTRKGHGDMTHIRAVEEYTVQAEGSSEGGQMTKRFRVFNETDGLYAHPRTLSEKEAARFIEEFRQRFERQGYYLTARGERIPAAEVRLVLKPARKPDKLTTVQADHLKAWQASHPQIPLKLHQYWFVTSMDGGETWQLTDGPFDQREAWIVKETMKGKWAIVQIMSVEGAK